MRGSGVTCLCRHGTVNVHAEDGSVTTLDERDTLDGGDVLPGFSMSVSAVFDV